MQKYILAYLAQKKRRHFTYQMYLDALMAWEQSGDYRLLVKRWPLLKEWFDASLQRQFWDDWQDSIVRGIAWSTPVDCDFPSDFLNLEDPIFLFRYRGHPIWTLRKNFGVVGAREPDDRSLEWLDDNLSTVLRQLPVAVISGGARGIDQKAHILALRSGCPTVVALPSGLSQVYPSQIQDLCEAVIDGGGAVISEYSNKERMQKSHFVERNRLIVSLSQVVLAVDIARRSGSMISARQAIQQSKPLLVLPSHPMDFKNAGGLDLLIEGATPVRDDKDLLIILEAEMNAQCLTKCSDYRAIRTD